jgi:chemotaxis protein methyltransferase CheR
VVVPSPIPSPQPAIRNPQSAIRNCADFCAAAHAHANVGDYERAIQCCQQAIALDAFAVEPHYLLAHVAEEQGDGEAAKRLWKRVIYLSPSCIAAYLELAALYEREGDAARANKMRETALEFLREMPTDDSVEFCENVTVGELVQRVKEMI